ncbi:hypothetical protein V8E36_005693 [Tilletia maclaganii]
MPVAASASSRGSRKRPASPSQPPPPTDQSNDNTTNTGTGPSGTSVKRQRLHGRARTAAAAAATASELARGSGADDIENTAGNAQPLLEAATVPQQPADDVEEPPKATRRADKGKAKAQAHEVSNQNVAPNAEAGPSSSSSPVASSSSGASPAAAPPLSRRSDQPSAPASGDQETTSSSASPAGSESFASAVAAAVLAAPAVVPPASESTHPREEDEDPSRETLLAKIAILERRLAASEKSAEAQTRILDGLHDRCSCDVCFDLMTRPCTLAPCGHIACRECLVAYWKQPSPDEPPLPEGLPEHRRANVVRHRTLVRVKRCPVCRSECAKPPAEAWLMKQIVGDIEHWKEAEDRQVTRELLRRGLENEAEAERLRQERTLREAGSSRSRPSRELPASPVGTTAVTPSTSTDSDLSDQLKERAQRLKNAEAVKKEDAGTDKAKSATAQDGKKRKKASGSLSEHTVAARVEPLNLFPSDDEDEVPQRRSSAGAGGSQASQAEVVASARAQREAQMGQETWSDIFSNEEDRLAMRWDADDQVFRCPDCHGEVLRDEYCHGCQIQLRRPVGLFEDDNADDVRRLEEHRLYHRGYAADSDEEPYVVSDGAPSEVEYEGPWLEDDDDGADEEDDHYAHGFHDFDREHLPAGHPDDGDESDLSDFIVHDEFDGGEDSEAEDEEDDGFDHQYPYPPEPPAFEDEQDGEDEDSVDEHLLQQELGRLRDYIAYGSPLHGDDDKDDEDVLPMAPSRRRSGNMVLDDDEEDDEDEERRWADQQLYNDEEDDVDEGMVEEQDPYWNHDHNGIEEEEEDDDDEHAYLYPHYYDDDEDPGEDDFEEQSLDGFQPRPGFDSETPEPHDDPYGPGVGGHDDEPEDDPEEGYPHIGSAALRARAAAYAQGLDAGLEFDRRHEIDVDNLFRGPDPDEIYARVMNTLHARVRNTVHATMRALLRGEEDDNEGSRHQEQDYEDEDDDIVAGEDLGYASEHEDVEDNYEYGGGHHDHDADDAGYDGDENYVPVGGDGQDYYGHDEEEEQGHSEGDDEPQFKHWPHEYHQDYY